MKILVVDDDETFLDKMEKHLELENHSVVTSVSSTEALEQLQQEKFELVLTDLKMPDLSGVDLLKTARQQGNDSIFIVITGYGTIESAVDAIRTGAYDYLLKPFELSLLKEKIKQVEDELRFRESIKIPLILERLTKVEDFDLNSLQDDFPSPFLVISDKNPEIIIKKYNLNPATPLWLSFDEENGTILLSKLNSLKAKIEDFVTENPKGTIILKGIEALSRFHDWDSIKQFLLYIQTEVLSSNLELLILIENLHPLPSPSPTLYYDALSSFISTAFNKLVEIVSHSVRKDIILLLKTQDEIILSFNEILKKLAINSSSILSFHLKKLVKEEILIKEKSSYSLSSKGQYVANIIKILEKLGEHGPLSPIKIFRITHIQP